MRVNDVAIHKRDYEDYLADYLRSLGRATSDPETEAAFRRVLVEDMLLFDYARRVGADREPEFRREAERRQRQLLVDYVRRTRIQAHIEVTPEEVAQYYERNLAEYTTPRMVQVRVIQTSLLREAEEVLRRLRQGRVSFAELAQTFSTHPSRARGGDLDPFARGAYSNKVFEEAAFSLKIGEISGVISTDQGYFVLEKVAEFPEKRQPLAEVRARIEQRLRKEKTDRARTAFIDSLRRQSTIESAWESRPAQSGGGGR